MAWVVVAIIGIGLVWAWVFALAKAARRGDDMADEIFRRRGGNDGRPDTR